MGFKHRKGVHPSTQKCTYYNTEKGCKHGLDCLYIHEEMMEEATQQSDTNPRNLSPAHSCRICNESFSSKHELMKHRKKDHRDKVRPCRDFLQNVCHRGVSKCWYKHETNQAPNLQSQQGYPKLPATQHPPDQFQELKEMITQLSEKVDLQQVQLEKQNQQKVRSRSLSTIWISQSEFNKLKKQKLNMVFNYSNITLSEAMENVLNRGLNFCVMPNKLDLTQVLMEFRKFERTMIWQEFWYGTDTETTVPIFKSNKTNLPKKHKTPPNLKIYLSSFKSEIMDPQNRQQAKSNLPPEEMKALKELISLQRDRISLSNHVIRGQGS